MPHAGDLQQSHAANMCRAGVRGKARGPAAFTARREVLDIAADEAVGRGPAGTPRMEKSARASPRSRQQCRPGAQGPKKKMQREGVFREMKLRRNYEKPSERRAREKAEAVRRYRKLLRKRMEREGY